MTTQAAVTISRAALMWGASAGVGTLVLLNNGESSGFFREISKHAIHLITKPDGSARLQLPPHLNQPNDSSSLALAEQVSRLSAEVQRLRNAGYRDSSSGSGIGIGIIVAGGASVGLIMYIKGYTFGDLMYVTKKHFVDTIEKLKSGLETLGDSLESARSELAEKIGLVDSRVEETRLSLEQKIEQEVGQVQKDVAAVGQDVKGILNMQGRVQRIVHSLEDKFFTVDGKLDETRHQISVANRGILLLCNVVADSMATSGTRHNQSRYDELMQFSRQELHDVSPASALGKKSLFNNGLKMLVGGESSSETGPSLIQSNRVRSPLTRSFSTGTDTAVEHPIKRTSSTLHSRLAALSIFPTRDGVTTGQSE